MKNQRGLRDAYLHEMYFFVKIGITSAKKWTLDTN